MVGKNWIGNLSFWFANNRFERCWIAHPARLFILNIHQRSKQIQKLIIFDKCAWQKGWRIRFRAFFNFISLPRMSTYQTQKFCQSKYYVVSKLTYVTGLTTLDWASYKIIQFDLNWTFSIVCKTQTMFWSKLLLPWWHFYHLNIKDKKWLGIQST